MVAAVASQKITPTSHSMNQHQVVGQMTVQSTAEPISTQVTIQPWFGVTQPLAVHITPATQIPQISTRTEVIWMLMLLITQ